VRFETNTGKAHVKAIGEAPPQSPAYEEPTSATAPADGPDVIIWGSPQAPTTSS
jgi:hypothetical protein